MGVPKFDDSLIAAAKLYKEGRKLALLDQTVDAIHCLIKALELLDPMQGQDHRLLRAETLNQLGMVEIWRGRYGTSHDMLDEATKLDPTKAIYWAFLSQAAMKLGAKDRALECSLKAESLDNTSAIVMHTLAEAWTALGNNDKAKECYIKAGEVTPNDPNAYYLLGNCCYVAGQKEEAEKWYKKAVDLAPDHPDANYGYSVCLTERLKYLEAMPYIIKGMESQISGYPSQWSKALAHLVMGEYEQGWKDHEVRHRFMRQEYGAELTARRFNKPFWYKDLPSGHVHVYSEQGFGDCLQYVRFVKSLLELGNKVTLEVDKSMVKLMQFNFPSVRVIPFPADFPNLPLLEDEDSIDYRMPMGSLPFALENTLETIPYATGYLKAEPESIAKWSEEIAGTFKVGICWAGGKRVQDKNLVAMDERRSISFETIKPLLDIENVTFYSLQTGLPAEEAKDDQRINKLDLKTWSDTAGIIANLDMVISVDTSVLHLAAAMGKKTWLINKWSTCWRWMLDRADSPWYDTIRIFRQPHAYDWATVINQIKEELE